MTASDPAPARGTDSKNRRSAARLPSSCTIQLSLDPDRIEGKVQDVSAHGLAFFADGPLSVVIQVAGEAEPRVLAGRLVRVESVTDDRCVVAVRFDQPVDPDDFPRD